MRFLFIVQGEGHGHMTQALSLKQMLSRENHRVCAVMVGKSRSRVIPSFFLERMQSPILIFESPNFRSDSQQRGVSILGTFLENTKRFPFYVRSLLELHRAVRHYKPDIIVNFLDPLAAIYVALWRPRVKAVCIAHHYIMFHPQFVFPKGKRLARLGMMLFIWLSALGADYLLALSFKKLPNVPKHKLIVMPPLLRDELKHMTPTTEDFILAYIFNEGYANDLAAKQRQYPDIKFLGFWDKEGAPECTCLQRNLVFRQINDTAFLDAMSRCRGFVSTAGFESICEAMYLGKPVYMIPVKHQIEQHCNAIDAHLAGAGIWGFGFDIECFFNYLSIHQGDPESFRKWVDSADKVYRGVMDRIKHASESSKK